MGDGTDASPVVLPLVFGMVSSADSLLVEVVIFSALRFKAGLEALKRSAMDGVAGLSFKAVILLDLLVAMMTDFLSVISWMFSKYEWITETSSAYNNGGSNRENSVIYYG